VKIKRQNQSEKNVITRWGCFIYNHDERFITFLHTLQCDFDNEERFLPVFAAHDEMHGLMIYVAQNIDFQTQINIKAIKIEERPKEWAGNGYIYHHRNITELVVRFWFLLTPSLALQTFRSNLPFGIVTCDRLYSSLKNFRRNWTASALEELLYKSTNSRPEASWKSLDLKNPNEKSSGTSCINVFDDDPDDLRYFGWLETASSARSVFMAHMSGDETHGDIELRSASMLGSINRATLSIICQPIGGWIGRSKSTANTTSSAAESRTKHVRPLVHLSAAHSRYLTRYTLFESPFELETVQSFAITKIIMETSAVAGLRTGGFPYFVTLFAILWFRALDDNSNMAAEMLIIYIHRPGFHHETTKSASRVQLRHLHWLCNVIVS
jgi:hypothetical protein